jgi:hypothetical protein
MMEPEIITRFLESVGQKADVELYLKLFRAQRKESFAILAAGAQIVKNALDPVHFDLRILTGLGLIPSVVLGLFEPKDADRQAQRVQDWLVEDAVPARIVPTGAELGPSVIDAVRTAIGAGEIPLVTLEGAREASIEKRFRLLAPRSSRRRSRRARWCSSAGAPASSPARAGTSTP